MQKLVRTSWFKAWMGKRPDAVLVGLFSALFFGMLAFLLFPVKQQFIKYPLAATQLLAGTLPQERLLDFSPLYLQLHMLQARLFPGSSVFVTTVQIAAAAISSALLYLLLLPKFGRWLAIAGVAAFVLNRSMAGYVCIFEPEVLLVLFLLCFLWAMEQVEIGWAAAAGLALALSLLTRPNFMLLLAIAPIYLFLRHGRSQTWLRQVILFLLFPLLALGLLSARHHSAEGKYSPLVMNPGFVFFEANNPLSIGQSSVVPPLVGELRNEIADVPDNPHIIYRLLARRDAGEQLSTAAANSYWAALALNYIADYPWRWLRLEGRKFYFLWHQNRRYDMAVAFSFNNIMQQRLIPAFPFALISALALFGLAVSVREWRNYLIYYALFTIQAMAMLIFYVSDRQRLALLPLFVFFACAGVKQMLTLPLRLRLAVGAAMAAGFIFFSIPSDLMRDDPYIWDSDQRSDHYWMEAGRLRDLGNMAGAGRAAALSFASATWFEDHSRPAYIPFNPDGFAARAVELWPELARTGASAEFDYGVLLLAAEDVNGAEQIFTRLLAAGRRFDRGFLQSSRPEYFMGRIALRRGAYRQARQWFELALKRSPGEPFTLAHLAALTGAERYRNELQRYFGGIESDWHEGVALLEQGRAAEAQKRLYRLTQTLPELRRGKVYLAAASGAAGETLQGAEFYMRATRDQPDPVMLETQILNLFADLVKIQPDNAEAHYQQGMALAQFGHFREGIAAFDRAFSLTPTEKIARARVWLRGRLS